MDELLSGELFYTLWEAQVLIEQWPVLYNTELPHSLLGYRPRVPQHCGLINKYPGRKRPRKLAFNLDQLMRAGHPIAQIKGNFYK